MTTQAKFEYSRALEKQVRELQLVVQGLLADVRSLELDLEIAQGERDAVIDLCDTWKEKACDLQATTNRPQVRTK
tara:strand:+ start:387 stop:611 length:225 start_codon:yes stop_codon:yes gene_type:complete